MNRNILLVSVMFAFALNFSILGCNRNGEQTTGSANSAPEAIKQDTTKNPYVDAAIAVKTFANDSAPKGFGYDVYIDSALYVHQPHIPAVPGNRGFSSEQFARKTGEFVAWKIRNNILPPSLSEKELDSLKVLN